MEYDAQFYHLLHCKGTSSFLLLVSDLWGDSLAQCEYPILHQLQFQHQVMTFVNRHLYSSYYHWCYQTVREVEETSSAHKPPEIWFENCVHFR